MSSDPDDLKNPGGPEPAELTELLARQEEPGADDFLPKLRRRIHRRSASAQLATFSWELPKSALLQFAHLLKELAFAIGSGKGNRS